jgi:hypothetical protein
MKHLSIDFGKVKSCMNTAGGVNGSGPNEILNAELKAREMAGVIILPSFFVNQAALCFYTFITGADFDAISSGYKSGSN